MNSGSSNGTTGTLFTQASEIARPVTHSALDFFEQPTVLINYEGSFDQEVFPHVGCRGPQLDFVVSAENKNCIDLNRLCLALEVCIYGPDGKDKIKPADVDLTFANNILHSLFSHVELFLDGKLVSSSNNNYHHLAYIETELTTDIASNMTWAQCQGYHYRANEKSNEELKMKQLDNFRKGEEFKIELYGAPHIDFLDCERLLLPGVSLHLRFYRSPSNCALESVGTWTADDIKRIDQAPFSVVIEKASLFVNKIVLSDSVRVSIEKALLKSDAVYPYIESLNKSFITQAGQNCFVKENIFGTEPIRRLTLCMVRNKFFRGSTIECTPFRYKKFNLSKVEIQRGNGVPIAGTPIRTTNCTRLFYNTICALGFATGGNGIGMADFEDDHFFLVFDLTSSREASKTLTLFPELTGGGLTLKLDFSEALTDPVELFLVGERFSQVFIDSGRNIRKNFRSK